MRWIISSTLLAGSLVGLGLVGVGSPRVAAQWVDNKASTVGESHARGIADVTRSQGMYNLMTSEAALNMSDVQRKQLENYRLGTETYFEVRQMNRQYREAERGPRPTMEDAVRYAQMGRPRPLTSQELDSVSGQISWPILLQDERFAQHRDELEDIFARRAASGGLDADAFLRAQKLTDEMIGQLKQEVRDVPPQQYATAKTFLQSLSYAATQPTG